MNVLSRSRGEERDAGATRGTAVAVVAGAGLNMLVNTGPVLLFSFGVFVKPIVAETGWSQTGISSAVLYGQILLALCGPLTGPAVDRFGARRVARFAGPLLGLGLTMVGLLSKSADSFVLFFALSFLLGAAQVPVTYVKAVAGWYDGHLGLALGCALMLSGLGVAILPPLSAALIEMVGWRGAYLCLAGFVWLVSVPSVQWLLHEAPGRSRVQAAITRAVSASGGAGVVAVSVATPAMSELSGLPLRAAVRTRAFWLMALAFFLISVVVGAGTWVLPVVLSDYGLKARQGAFVMTIVGVAMMAGRLGFGALLDRFFAPRITAMVFIGAALGYLCLLAGISLITVPIAAILIGFALGSEVDALAFMTSRVFGRRHLGAIYGSLMFCFSVGLGCGPALFAQIDAHTGDYRAAFWSAAAAAVIAALAICGLRARDFGFPP